MATSEPRCLRAGMEEANHSAERGDAVDMRTRLTDMLRCSSRLTCDHAVPCSDDAMRTLRRVLGSKTSDR